MAVFRPGPDSGSVSGTQSRRTPVGVETGGPGPVDSDLPADGFLYRRSSSSCRRAFFAGRAAAPARGLACQWAPSESEDEQAPARSGSPQAALAMAYKSQEFKA